MDPRLVVKPGERVEIEAALLEGFEKSEADMCVLVSRACDDYGFAGWRLGVLLGGVAGCALAALVPFLPAAVVLAGTAGGIVLAATAGGIALGLGLARFDSVRRLLVSESLATQRVLDRAERGFAAAGLGAQKDGAGLLLFVALLERQVLLVAGDRVARIGRHDGTFDAVARQVADGFGRGRAGEALREAVARCGELLSQQLPGPSRPTSQRAATVVLED